MLQESCETGDFMKLLKQWCSYFTKPLVSQFHYNIYKAVSPDAYDFSYPIQVETYFFSFHSKFKDKT